MQLVFRQPVHNLANISDKLEIICFGIMKFSEKYNCFQQGSFAHCLQGKLRAYFQGVALVLVRLHTVVWKTSTVSSFRNARLRIEPRTCLAVGRHANYLAPYDTYQPVCCDSKIYLAIEYTAPALIGDLQYLLMVRIHISVKNIPTRK